MVRSGMDDARCTKQDVKFQTHDVVPSLRVKYETNIQLESVEGGEI